MPTFEPTHVQLQIITISSLLCPPDKRPPTLQFSFQTSRPLVAPACPGNVRSSLLPDDLDFYNPYYLVPPLFVYSRVSPKSPGAAANSDRALSVETSTEKPSGRHLSSTYLNTVTSGHQTDGPEAAILQKVHLTETQSLRARLQEVKSLPTALLQELNTVNRQHGHRERPGL